MIYRPSTTLSKWKDAPKHWIARIQQREEQVFLGLTLVIGALTGLAVVAFIVVSERLGMRLYPVGSPAWHRILIPVTGSLAMGYLLWRYFPDARGSGVPQTKAALFAREGKITFRTILGKFLCTAGTLASGLPLGREGPSVQIGGGIASVLGRWLGLRAEKVKALIPVGAAAAIAAAFNTPLAAVLFSLEEVTGDLHAPVLGSVVLASATSWMVLRRLLGNDPLFQVPQYQLVHPVEFVVYAVLGIAGGLVSVAFTQLLLRMRAQFLRMPERTRWLQPVAGGLATGALGLILPQVLGVGYGYVGDAINGRLALQLMALLIFFKLIAVTTSYASGNAGGIFGPALFIGAMLGGAVGGVAHQILPSHTAAPGAYALVGMGAAFAGIVRTPMTSVLMIFELTRDYAIIVPLMISNLVSFFISARLQPRPVYEELALQDGIHLPVGAHARPAGRRVAEVMRSVREAPALPPEMTVRDAVERMRASKTRSWLVTDALGIIGMLNAPTLQQAETLDGNRPIGDLLTDRGFPHVHPDQSLHVALERMGVAGLDVLPVVSRADVHQLMGFLQLDELLRSYGVLTARDK